MRFLMMLALLCAASSAQALNCPDGTQPVDNACEFEISGAGKQEMIEKIAQEGPDGPTARQARQYMQKVLGKDALAKLDNMKPQEEEEASGWLARMKSWLNSLMQ